MNIKLVKTSVAITMMATLLGAPLAQAGKEREQRMMGRDNNDCMMMGRGGMGMKGGGMGMMGRGGMGMGMMGGGGMMGMGPIHRLDLSDDQRKKINAIQNDLRKHNWNLMGQIMDEKARLRDLYAADKLDGRAIGKVYDRIFKTKKKMIETGIEARNKQYDMLTDKQRNELKRFRGGMGMMGGGMGMMQ